jgi:hypothetical protein
MYAWHFAKRRHAAQLHGWTMSVSMQDEYSLILRKEERGMFGLPTDPGLVPVEHERGRPCQCLVRSVPAGETGIRLSVRSSRMGHS